MRILCLGGSFNPIHHGHLLVARSAAEQGGFNQVRLIPNLVSPHKADQTIAPAADRLNMARLAAEFDPLFHVDDLELNRPPPSFTIDTVRSLRGAGLGRVTWLIGADMLPSLGAWRDAENLLKEADFLVVPRPGFILEAAAIPEPLRNLSHTLLHTPNLEISSTEIRNRVRTGLSIEYLTPPPVVRYIREHGLYRD
jgi:nicotinate-nucleotide adenylyltransferase